MQIGKIAEVAILRSAFARAQSPAKGSLCPRRILVPTYHYHRNGFVEQSQYDVKESGGYPLLRIVESSQSKAGILATSRCEHGRKIFTDTLSLRLPFD